MGTTSMCQLKLNRTLTFRNGENSICVEHNLKKFYKQILLGFGTKMLFNRLGRGILTIANGRHQNYRQIFKFGGSTDTGVYQVVRPGNVSPYLRDVPDKIERPSYTYAQDIPDLFQSYKNEIKLPNAVDAMRESCRLAANILDKCGQILKPGVTTEEIDEFVHEQTIASNAYPSPLLYCGFPKSVCTSVNNVVCHGIPDDRPLVDGDIINVDITVFYNNYHGDCSRTFLIGNVDALGRHLVKVTEECLHKGIEACGQNVPFKEIGAAIEDHALQNGLEVIKEFIGHGIGTYFHGKPEISHYRNTYDGVMMPGMTFTIEPILCLGRPTFKVLEDQWTAVTKDNSRTAQFEHTILIAKHGVEILTLPDSHEKSDAKKIAK
ncbi:methionine aminopeptidase 1D, mitochondrial [Sitodiplosis mosellana]|uniref:methionine aminopeptidase 1D, mitochondrial n=1 Tax=Sitodiplosis mosellana TaxID=263140 RepID=UPI00244538E6|nr:methionine aminopeptidase 1D, mitochondrial [Sitodiplosis mosellana]